MNKDTKIQFTIPADIIITINEPKEGISEENIRTPSILLVEKIINGLGEMVSTFSEEYLNLSTSVRFEAHLKDPKKKG